MIPTIKNARTVLELVALIEEKDVASQVANFDSIEDLATDCWSETECAAIERADRNAL
jgi:hypothetical protein